MKLNSYYTGFFLVFFAGLFWSFGAPTVRHMIDGEQYVLIGIGDGEFKKIKLSDIQKRNNKSKESK